MLKIKRILVPIDFSEYCTQALSHAQQLAADYESEVELLHVVEETVFPSFYKMGEEAMYGDVSSLRERAVEALSECVATDGPSPGEDVSFHVIEGYPGKEIVSFAERRDVDLIVISTHGLTGIGRVLMGSVAQKVVQHSPCPVFVIKSDGKSLTHDGVE